MRPTWADIDLGAIAHNIDTLAALAAHAQLCAVVKANGYGHGAVPVAKAALDAGATWLGVALVAEGAELRAAKIDVPVLLLSEPTPGEMAQVVAQDLRPSVYTQAGIAAAAEAAVAAGNELAVHLVVDTGMGRVGCSVDDAPHMAQTVANTAGVQLEGVWTHCPVADEPDANDFTNSQLDRFDALVARLETAGHTNLVVHAANSGGIIAHPRTSHTMVRCGISTYGLAPSPELEGTADLRPAMTVHSQVSMVKRVAPGTTVSYGRRWTAKTETTIATVPIGYADGIRRRLFQVGGQVLIGEKRYPLAGTVTMDQLMVDCGDDPIQAGQQVVLIGKQGSEEITADEMAGWLDTIGYEVVCDISQRVPRRYT